MSVSKMCLRFLSVLSVLLLVSFSASAQYRASIQGVVTDPEGAAVSGATITLTNLETNKTLTATSDENGVFAFNGLPPSRFSVTIEKSGFKKKTLEEVGVISDQANALNIALDLGSVSEQITVSGDATPLIDTETASGSGTVNARQYQALPSIGRDPFQLLQLAPGAFGDGAQSAGGGTSNLPGTTIGGTGASDGIFKTENGGQISANGARTGENNYTIDGVGMTSVSWGGTAVVTPNEDSIKEVKVITDNYDAEYGRYRGAQVQIISQNGTNQYHGSLYFKAHRPGLNAYQKWNGPFNGVQRDSNRFNDYGGSAGGPVLKNRLFLFFSYETISNNAASGTTSGWYETSQYRQLASSGTNAAAIMGYTGAGPNGGTQVDHSCAEIGLTDASHVDANHPAANCVEIPGQGLNLGRPLNSSFAAGTRDPSFQFVGGCGSMANQPECMPGLGGDGTGSASNLDPTTPTIAFFQNIPNPQSTNEKQYQGRVDFNLTSRDLIAFSIYYVPVSSTSLNGSGTRLMNNFNHQVLNEAYTGLWDHTFSPTLVNEARFNAAGWRWKDLELNPNGPWGLAPVNIANNPFNGNTIGSLATNGFGIGAPGTFDQWTYGAKDVVTKVSGVHTIKFGGEYTRLLFVDNSPWNARPTYWFNNYWDFLNDAAVAEQATFNPLTGVPTDFRKDTRSTLWAFFFQDNIKVKPTLTITAGLRWEYFGPISEKLGHLAVGVLGQGANEMTDMRVRVGGNLYNASLNNYGPQLGFAWSPQSAFGHDFRNRLVIRGGAGIGYNGLDEAISLNGRSNPPFVSATGILQNATNCGTAGNPICQILYIGSFPSDPHSFSGYASNPAAIATFDPVTNLPVPGTNNYAPAAITAFPSSWPTTTSYHYSLQGEYDLGHNWVASLEYQGSTTRHLTQQYNAYVIAATAGYALNPVVPGYDYFANDGSAHFNAFLAGIDHRFSNTFEINGQYRYSKSMDTASNNYQNGQYQYNLATNMGPSDYDVRNGFKVWGIYTPNFFKSGWEQKVLGGWSLSGIMNWHTGFPFTPIYFVADSLYQGSSGYGGTNQLRPAAYLGGAGSDYSNSTFRKKGGNFPNGGSTYFTAPTVVAGPAFDCVVATAPTAQCPSGRVPYGPVPTAPGVGRNSFRGPGYFNLDATLSKSFGLPKMPVLGENAKFEFRANFYNLFNKLNLTSVNNNVADAYFGTAMSALGGRVIEMQARFSF
jgi:hypothetical protein